MNTRVRRRLDMFTRIHEFIRAHGSNDPAHATIVAQFEQHKTRADEIAARQHQGKKAAKAARARRVELRRVLHFQLLRYLAAVGDAAARDKAELAQKLKLPSRNLSNRDFLVAAKSVLAEALAQKELLIAKGMSATLLDDVARLIAEMEVASEAALTGRRDHIGARTDLELICGELMEDVRLLDGSYMYRFGNDRELMSEWEAVRFILGNPQPAPPVPPAPGTGAAPAA